MMNIAYTSSQAYIPFLFSEFKKGCTLYLQSKTIEDIYQETMEDNTFNTNSVKRKQEFSSFVCKRLTVLDDFLIKTVANSNSETGRLICLYSIMKTDPLFFEFMYEVFQQKRVLSQDYLDNQEMQTFMREKSFESEIVARWSDNTTKRLLSGYRNSLLEGGLLIKEGKKLKINYKFIPQEIKEHLISKGDEMYLRAMIGDYE